MIGPAGCQSEVADMDVECGSDSDSASVVDSVSQDDFLYDFINGFLDSWKRQ